MGETMAVPGNGYFLVMSIRTLLLIAIATSWPMAVALGADPTTPLSFSDTSNPALQPSSVQFLKSLAVSQASSTVFDSNPPAVGTMNVTQTAKSAPVAVSFSGVTDGTGSGLKTVRLWMKKGDTGPWGDSGLTPFSVGAGSWSFSGFSGDGHYYFALKADDNAGNLTPDPSGAGSAHVAFDATAPTITLVGNPTVTVGKGATYTDAGAKAVDTLDGDLTTQLAIANAVNTQTPGSYTVAFNVKDKAGNAATEVKRTVIVQSSYILTLTQPPKGTIQSNPAPSSDGGYAAGAEVTLTYVPEAASGYDLTGWTGATQDAQNPNVARVTMNTSVTVTAELERQMGIVAVEVTPTTAAWTITDGDGETHDGAGTSSLDNIPTGAVAIVFKALTGYTPPASQNATLAKGATVSFKAALTATGTVVLAIPADLQGKPGAVVEAPINVSGVTQGITAYSVQVNFDGAILEFSDATAAGLTSSWSPISKAPGADSVQLSASGTNAVANDGALAVLKLKVKDTVQENTPTDLLLASASLNNGSLQAGTQDGHLNIQVGEFMWGDVDNDGTAGSVDSGLILQYRVGKLEQLPALEGASDPNFVGGADVSGDDPPVIGTFDAALILSKQEGLITQFPADLNADGMGPEVSTGNSPAESLVAESDQSVTRSITTLGGLTASSGTLAQVPIFLDNGASVYGYYFDLAFDSSALELVKVEKGTLTQMWAEPTVNSQPSRVSVASAGAQSLAGGGSLAVVTFRGLGAPGATQNATLNLELCELDDGLIPAQITQAKGAPIIAGITPDSGATDGGTVVIIRGSNLADVTDVTFGNTPAPWFQADPSASTITAVTPPGTGPVQVQVFSALGEDFFDSYTYFTPAVYLTLDLDPQASVSAGSTLSLPIMLELPGGGQPSSVNFTLRYDPTAFALPTSAQNLDAAVAGAAATSASKQVSAKLLRPGQLSVSVSGGSKIMQPGVLCTCNLFAISRTTQQESLLYLSDITASTLEAKSLTVTGSITGESLPSRK
ncbi:MAG: DUF5011 domain-containing protein [Candidatus Hydrogenedentes bacterium]|nr:DUF5011 domain-containing protein [Candidatus Hydrogenedentota bacterium]